MVKFSFSLLQNQEIYNNSIKDNRVTVKNCLSFPITTLCSYSKILPYRELPHHYNLDTEEIWRYPAYFYGYSFDKYRCNFGLWLSTDTKKNINILMPFYYNQDMRNTFKSIGNDSWLRLRYSLEFTLYKKNIKMSPIKHTNFFNFKDNNLRGFFSDVTLELQKNYNRFHRAISFNPLFELDFSITNFNYRWWKQYHYNEYCVIVQRSPFYISDNAFLSSSFFITSYDTALIGYPQGFFENLSFFKMLSSCFNLLDVFKFNKLNYLSGLSSILYLVQNVFYDAYIFKINSLFSISSNYLFLLKLIFIRFFLFKNKKKLNAKKIDKYDTINFFNKNIIKKGYKKLFTFLKYSIIKNKISSKYFLFFKSLNLKNMFLNLDLKNKNKSVKLNYYSFLYKLNKQMTLVYSRDFDRYQQWFTFESLLDKTDSLAHLINNSQEWFDSYVHQNKLIKSFNKLCNQKAKYNFISNSHNILCKVRFDYFGILSVKRDFIFKSFIHKVLPHKGMLIYSLARRYKFGIDRLTSVLFPSNKNYIFKSYKYSQKVFRVTSRFITSIFKFFCFNLNNYLSVSIDNIRISFYSFIYYFAFFKKRYMKKSKYNRYLVLNRKIYPLKNENKFKKNKLLLNLFLSHKIYKRKIIKFCR